MCRSNRNTIKTKNLNSFAAAYNVGSNLPYQRQMSIFSPNNHLKLLLAPNILFFTEHRIDWNYLSNSSLRL